MNAGPFRPAVIVLLVALACGAATASPAISQGKTEVGVVFELSDPRYTDEFTDPELLKLKADAIAAVARVLGDKVRFLDFGTNTEADYRLSVRLDRAEGSRAEGPAEFGFHFSLAGPGVRDDARDYLVFRAKDQYSTPIGAREALVREIEIKLKEADHGSLVRQVFRHVPIAEEADFHRRPLGWIVDRNRTALCVDRDSRLEVVNAFPSFGDMAHHPFVARVVIFDRPEIIARADTSVHSEMIEELMAADPMQVRVERVFIVDYRRFCPEPVPGDQVDFSGEGEGQ